MRRVSNAVTVALLSLLLIPSAGAGDVSSDLREEMARRLADDPIGIIVMLEDRVDISALNQRLDAMNATRAFRHQIVIETLQEKARQTQGPVLARINELSINGLVSEPRALWITNAVTMKATSAAILDLAQTVGVETVYLGEYALQTIQPTTPPSARPSAGSRIQGQTIEPGLLDIKADFLWALGFTGAGRVVSNLDTGVNSDHTALQNWLGHDPGITPEEAWFDPVTNTSVPFDNIGHGSHTMGTMCGSDINNIVGVAYDAKWIAAGVIDRVDLSTTIADALLAFQWTADPDGDATTIQDVPDVSSNSWGISPLFHGVPPCDATFWEVIDGTEAAGCVVVFAAGNEGPGPQTLRTPADRPTSDVNAFSVGALRPGSNNIAGFSSRGPSGCDLGAIKPEVTAQGEDVRSAWTGQHYITISGTSMAVPHAGGAVALLRQVWPNISSNEVKRLLMDTAVDLGAGGDDNDYGHGRINLEAAYNELLARLPDVSAALMTSNDEVAQGGNLEYFVALSNHTGTTQPINIVIEIERPSDGLTATILAVNGFNLPSGFDNANQPFHLSLGIPLPTPPPFVNVPLVARIRVLQAGSGTLISSAEFGFEIQ